VKQQERDQQVPSLCQLPRRTERLGPDNRRTPGRPDLESTHLPSAAFARQAEVDGKRQARATRPGVPSEVAQKE